jgi:fatty acid synthase
MSKKFFDWMHENSNYGCIKPINRTVFKPKEAEQAFSYITTGKHIAKTVIKMREKETKVLLNGFNPTFKMKATVKTYFDPKKGLYNNWRFGWIWSRIILLDVVFKGAKKIVLTSRTRIRTNYQKVILKRFEGLGKKYETFKSEIIVSILDTIEGSEELLKEVNKLGPIGGIFHLAVALNDRIFRNHTIDSFRETCESKINNLVNLDELTRNSYPDLEYFVGFSSVSCNKGNFRQTNYGYANSVIERICEMRRRDGFHGLAIQWGPIGDVGPLADDENLFKVAAVVKQRILSCLEVMDKFLQFSYPVLSSTVSNNYYRLKRIFFLLLFS